MNPFEPIVFPDLITFRLLSSSINHILPPDIGIIDI